MLTELRQGDRMVVSKRSFPSDKTEDLQKASSDQLAFVICNLVLLCLLKVERAAEAPWSLVI